MNHKTFEKDFLEFKNELLSFIYRMVTNRQDAEDIVQDTYIKASSQLDRYDEEKASLKTWVFTISLNTARNHLSKMKRWGENDLTTCENLHSNSQI